MILGDSDNKYLFTVNTTSGNHPKTQVETWYTKVNLIDLEASVSLLKYDLRQQICEMTFE